MVNYLTFASAISIESWNQKQTNWLMSEHNKIKLFPELNVPHIWPSHKMILNKTRADHNKNIQKFPSMQWVKNFTSERRLIAKRDSLMSSNQIVYLAFSFIGGKILSHKHNITCSVRKGNLFCLSLDLSWDSSPAPPPKPDPMVMTAYDTNLLQP